MIYILPTNTCFGISCSLSDIKNYERIYKIKKRNLDKPLAILVEDFKYLAKNTDLTEEQIDFLKNYEKPFTILTDSTNIKTWLNFVNLETNEEFINRGVYEKIAFRVAHNKLQKELCKKNGPMFLTSANISDKPEIYKTREINDEFSYYLEKGTIKFIGKNGGDLQENKTSDIFEFIGETTDLHYLRQN